MSSTPGVIILDLDGTLADTVPGIAHAANHTLSELGLAPVSVEQIRNALGGGARKLWATILGEKQNVLLDEALASFGPYYAENPDWGTVLYPGVAETLPILAAHTQLAVATQKGRLATQRVLQTLGIAGLFAAIVTVDDMAAPKPDPDCVNQILAQLHLPAAAAVVVGDMPYDVDTARNAGVRCWVVSYGYGPELLLASGGYERMIERFDQLRELIVTADD
ncbi:MAG: HAD-IA family hydrolase [Propionibacteriaceae bacterium]|jgi:phosphoglycolate phosphatase|nr:HAD-IA family hydrolase [Propionibacteriaceae bacterium]